MGRAEERNAAIREGLVPLAPDERPLALRASAALAALIAVGNLVALAAGATVNGQRPVVAALVLSLLMAGFAVGLWRKRYLVVLAWQALLGITLVYATLSLMLASNLRAVLICVALIVVAAPLFWLLVRIMARIQAPPR
jgi:hypothetical protein